MLSVDTIDAVAVDSLKWYRDHMLDDMICYEDDTGYLHPDDYVRYTRLIVDFNSVLEYYGESSKGTLDRRKEVLKNGV